VEPAVQLQYTPLVDRRLHYYNVGLQSISLGKKSLGVSMVGAGIGSCLNLASLALFASSCINFCAVCPLILVIYLYQTKPALRPRLLQGEYAKGYGAVLDSGTTFTYLPTAAFNAFLALLSEALQGKGLHRSSGADQQVWQVVPSCCLVLP
jgi:hypothetical protein